MDVFTALSTRASYRGRYTNAPVSKEDLIAILRAGADAPSGCNAQTASFIAVTEPELLTQIGAILNKPSFASAPAAICVLTEPIPVYAGNIYNVQDYAAAIENMLIAITALGYASCWVEGYVTMGDVGKRIGELLGVPVEKELVCFLPIGVPETRPTRPQKKPLESRAWFNGYMR